MKNNATQIGGYQQYAELERLASMVSHYPPASEGEYQMRLDRLIAVMRGLEIPSIFLSAGSNLRYFTGIEWNASERLSGVLINIDHSLHYILPGFERDTFAQKIILDGTMHCWEEHEKPARLVGGLAHRHGRKTRLAVDEKLAYGMALEIVEACADIKVVSSEKLCAPLRYIKSAYEISTLKRVKAMTLEVQRSAARILHLGINTREVTNFIDQAHRAIGAECGSFFCITLFGKATAHPHGVDESQVLKQGDMVLIDTGCELHGYKSDITRSYVYGDASARQRDAWNVEKQAQQAAFNAALPGMACEEVDTAARQVLEQHGFGPDYRLPGLPHRTGHGIGLDIHEGPYLVKGNETRLEPGMCFSNEPMLVFPGEMGIRLEDHFYMTAEGASWFTEPSPSIEQPFADRV